MLRNKATCMRPPRSRGEMQSIMSAPASTPVSISAYCLAFLIVFYYMLDTLHYYCQHNLSKYLAFRIGVFVVFLIGQIVLVIYDHRNRKQANRVFLIILQGLSLLQSFCLEVTIGLEISEALVAFSTKRVFLIGRIFSMKRVFYWAVFLYCLVVLGFGAAAIYSFLHGIDVSSRICLTIALAIAHNFPNCYSIYYLRKTTTIKQTTPIYTILYFRLFTYPASLFSFFILKATTFLMSHTAIYCLYNILLVALKLCNSIRPKAQVELHPGPTLSNGSNGGCGKTSHKFRLDIAFDSDRPYVHSQSFRHLCSENV
ncbi:hypothetical protein BDZ45DRAFT_812025 [Acephala macrosclerotiorum]|nr:hypothetical protein BDZ45DRAFT_812025 [Acephala macrosclerotiorum]